MRLQQDLREADAASAERARLARSSGWRFVVNAFLAIVTLTLVVALASVLGVRSSSVVAGDPTGDPSTPLTITGVSLVQGGIDGGSVHVAATQRDMVVAFPPSPLWRTSPRACSADIVGVLDWQGTATWLGPRAGHSDVVAGDPSSRARRRGLGDIAVGRFISFGPSDSSSGVAPGGNIESGMALVRPGPRRYFLAYYPGRNSTRRGLRQTSTTRDRRHADRLRLPAAARRLESSSCSESSD